MTFKAHTTIWTACSAAWMAAGLAVHHWEYFMAAGTCAFAAIVCGYLAKHYDRY